jgi:hypothetical protein
MTGTHGLTDGDEISSTALGLLTGRGRGRRLGSREGDHDEFVQGPGANGPGGYVIRVRQRQYNWSTKWEYRWRPGSPTGNSRLSQWGEVLADSVTVTWVATDPDSRDTAILAVDLDYSDNAGATWSSIKSEVPIDGAYVQGLNGLPRNTDYMIRATVTDGAGLSDSDRSDSVFTIQNSIYIADQTGKLRDARQSELTLAKRDIVVGLMSREAEKQYIV